MKREILKVVKGQRTVDGAGVNLVRVLGHDTVNEFDPFLMLDAFDSTDPNDYIKGFPFHPHRGIETVTYLVNGEMEHQDSLGNKGVIRDGECQWMTAGSGIMHQEMPKSSDKMLGLQLWVNLPKEDKMTDPQYFDISKDMIKTFEDEKSTVKVIAGNYMDKVKGVDPKFIKVTLLDVDVKPNEEFNIDLNEEDNMFIYVMTGEGTVAGKKVESKSAVLFNKGDEFSINASENGIRFILFAGKPLHEPVAWAGPVVMNTKDQLQVTFKELDEGTFIKHNPNM
jgi:redox-sensitive bicupin YhaK (pirin superfamily)